MLKELVELTTELKYFAEALEHTELEVTKKYCLDKMTEIQGEIGSILWKLGTKLK